MIFCLDIPIGRPRLPSVHHAIVGSNAMEAAVEAKETGSKRPKPALCISKIIMLACKLRKLIKLIVFV
jgi:hypothetical protein